MTLEEINQIDIVDYLASMNIQPKQKQGQQHWYISPIRDEETKPSFKVNRSRNQWWDFSLKKGSSLIDFVLAYEKYKTGKDLTMREVKERFAGPGGLTPYVPQPRTADDAQAPKRAEVDRVIPIQSLYLLQYLKERRIDPKVAREFNKEIWYHFTGSDKQYYALGLPNDAGGWELRNKYHKYTSDPKGPSTIRNGSDDIAAFEGNFNMLTLATALSRGSAALPDFHVTNSAEKIDDTLKHIQGYRFKYLFFDNDRQGDALTAAAMREPGARDMRGLYKNHNDINQWAQELGKIHIPTLQEIQAINQANDPYNLSPGLHIHRSR